MSRKQILERVVFETSYHPFGVTHYNKQQKVIDFVGRKEELHQFNEYLQIISKTSISIAVRLEGPAGVGKSTLFNFLKESILREKSDEKAEETFLHEKIDVLSTYFQLAGNINSFQDIWKSLVEGFRGEFDAETDFEIGLPDYVVYKFIYRLFINDREAIAKIIWQDTPRFKELKYIKFDDIIKPIYDDPVNFIPRIQQYFMQNKRRIRYNLKTTIGSEKYEVHITDTDRIIKLFHVLDEDDDYYASVNNGDPAIFPNDDSLISFLNDLSRFYSISTGKQLILLIGIDEIAKFSKSHDNADTLYFTNLGNLLVRLRDNLDRVLFTFISTTEDWAQFDNVITKKTDLSGQLLPILKPMSLKPLSIDDTIRIFKNRMTRFWNNYQTKYNSKCPYYPFSDFFFQYTYQSQQRDLRRSIILLNEIWSDFRFRRKIPDFNQDFDILRFIRNFKKKPLTGDNLHKFEWEIIEKYFDTSRLSKSNSTRSGAIEKGLEHAWRTYQLKEFSEISGVLNNPTIKTDKGRRRPDVLIEIAGNLGKDHRRRVEFQVKVYQNKKISEKDIESSIHLFEEGYTDLLFFIATGNGFDSNAEYRIEKLLDDFPNRIRKSILRRDQELTLKFLALFVDIVGWEMGTNVDHDLSIAENCLRNILGQSPEAFINMVKLLSSRGFIEEEEIKTNISDFFNEAEDDPQQDNGGTEEEDRTSEDTEISSETDDEEELDISPAVSWISNYPTQERYKYEACALASYLQSRETGRYANKFTIATVSKNVIRQNAALDNEGFRILVKNMEKNGLLKKERTSFVLTNNGLEWYQAIKKKNFQP